ncbi:hypothetical protein PO909_020597, partial [Leuciscus waleckii]
LSFSVGRVVEEAGGTTGLLAGSGVRSSRRSRWSYQVVHQLVCTKREGMKELIIGGVAAFVTTPLDVAKTWIMLAKAGTSTASGNIPVVLYEVWRSRGIAGLVKPESASMCVRLRALRRASNHTNQNIGNQCNHALVSKL